MGEKGNKMENDNSGASAPVAEAVVDNSPEAIENEEVGTEVVVKPTPEEKKRIKKLMLKVDGEEFEEDLPFEIDEDQADYMKRHLQLSRMSQKRAQYSSQIEKEAHQLIEMLRSDPRKVLSDPAINVDIRKLALEFMEEEIENSKKSPEQLDKERMEAELKSLKEEQKKRQEESSEREKHLLTEKAFQEYDNALTAALEKNPDLPKSPYVVKKMAENMLLALKHKIDLSPEDIVPIVRAEIQEDLKQMFAVLPEDVIEQLVGKDKISSIRKKYMNKAKAAPLLNALTDTSKRDQKPGPVKEKVSFKKHFGF